jgi:hypothetical protein
MTWLLTVTAAANCSTLAEIGGSTCYPAAAELHTLGGWAVLIAFAGAVLAAVTGRPS